MAGQNHGKQLNKRNNKKEELKMLKETTEILWLMPVTIGIVVFVPAIFTIYYGAGTKIGRIVL